MIGFFIKKAFFDGWDNFIGLLLQNLIYLGVLSLGILAGMLFNVFDKLQYAPWISELVVYGLWAILLFVACLFMGGTSSAVYNYSNYEKTTWDPFAKGIGENIKHSVLYFFVLIFFILVFTVVIPFYRSMNGVFGILLSVILFWVVFGFLLAVPFYFALMTYLPGDGPFKTLKKCFIIVVDNLGFSLFYMLYNLVLLLISIFSLGVIPGISGMMLASQDAIKILMKKYDWLEEVESGSIESVDGAKTKRSKRKIPWAELLYEEKEKVGPRSLKSMLFPWKF